MKGNFLPVNGFAKFYLSMVLQSFTKYEAYRQAKVSLQTTPRPTGVGRATMTKTFCYTVVPQRVHKRCVIYVK